MIDGLYERLQTLRIKSGFTQKELASRLGVSPSIISGYETGERTPSAEILLKLSGLLHCSTDYLLGIDVNRPIIVLDTSGLNEDQISALSNLIKTMKQTK